MPLAMRGFSQRGRGNIVTAFPIPNGEGSPPQARG
jgi:hypothetical protein